MRSCLSLHASNIILTPDVERTSVIARAFDTNSTLGPLVKSVELRCQAAPFIYPLSVHVVGRLSNVQKAIFAALNKHQPFDTSFIRLFVAPCQSLKMMTLAFIGFPNLSDLVRILWSFPSLESLMLQHCSWGDSPTDALPDASLHPGHTSKLTGLTLWLYHAARPPLSLAPFGTNLTKLDIDPLHSFASTVDYKGLAALEKLVIFTLRLTKSDIAVAPQALSHIRSTSLRWLGIAHRVEEQSPEATVRQLETLNPKLADVLERPTFWDLKGLRWAVHCRVLPAYVAQQKWKRAVTPFVPVMEDRKLLSVVIEGLASLERLASLDFVSQALSLSITHRVEDQTVEETVRPLDALNPNLQELLARPAFWDLRSVSW
ncbi:hypothetical protein K466DRAFT_654268 [Polyporus arcularius HHB13444]|uniref:F-box domain-containing protein n=1 Tax=Polyporus arcularius HHB13444 TaxID=1314778 RepID=A0A5C3PB22_9APHY|nr:hypothetical protein K466DRAFT_654268 [Polyporus arcularius HHB13444]